MSCDCSLFSVLFEGTQHFPDPPARHAKGFGNLGALYTFLIGLDNALVEGFLGRKRKLSDINAGSYSRHQGIVHQM